MSEVECPTCKGKGKEVVLNAGTNGQRSSFNLAICSDCNGAGKVSREAADKLMKRDTALSQKRSNGKIMIG